MNILELFLGILTAMGGFVEVGELTFAVNAGAKFGYSLLWIAGMKPRVDAAGAGVEWVFTLTAE